MSNRPHKFPQPAPDGDIIAWKCAACDQWINEYAYDERGDCPVDWNKRTIRERVADAIDELIR